jgi:glycerophosphoryl diester phosphodiesterase
MGKPVIFAHRGASAYCPENTMSAFRKAVELGADGIETDVRMTRDGRIVCIHDGVLGRTVSGNEPVRELAWAELSERDAGGWFGPEFAGERVPTLEELMELAEGHDLILNIELKGGSDMPAELPAQVARIVRKYGWLRKTVISSFHHPALAAIRAEEPELETAILYDGHLDKPWDAAFAVSARTIHPSYGDATETMIRSSHAHGCKVNVWTVNDPELARRLIAYGADGIITDVPDLVRQAARDL